MYTRSHIENGYIHNDLLHVSANRWPFSQRYNTKDEYIEG